MLIAQADHTIVTKLEFAPGLAVCEVSSLQPRLVPGRWPDAITYTREDGRTYLFERRGELQGGEDSDGEDFGGFYYIHRPSGRRLDVLND